MRFIETKLFLLTLGLMTPLAQIFNEQFYGNYLNQIIIFALPLLWPGIAHGSLDVLIARNNKIINNNNDTFLFLIIYISIPIIFFYTWIIFPNIIFMIFLLLSIFHFGLSDCITNKKVTEILIRGGLVILLPFKFHLEKTIEIFGFFLVNEVFLMTISVYFNYIYIILVLLIFLNLSQNLNKLFSSHQNFSYLIEIIGLFFCFWFFEPLVSFFIYFCFLHSVRHLIDEKRNLKLSHKSLFFKTLPMTAITVIFFIILFFLFQNSPENLNINYVVIGLSSLTVSHILLTSFTKKN